MLTLGWYSSLLNSLYQTTTALANNNNNNLAEVKERVEEVSEDVSDKKSPGEILISGRYVESMAAARHCGGCCDN